MSLTQYKRMSGLSLIEVLVTLVILMTGLLGLAGLQGRALTTQLESYQRSQALVLIKDMADRLNANRVASSSYVTSTPRGVGAAACTLGTNIASNDLCEWSNALKGSAEGATTGAMIGARGCVYELQSTLPKKYLIAIAWQGLAKSATPTATIDCGLGLYGSDGGFRRLITLPVTIGNLS
jgi:type IV pilus assembly protein PilV